MANLFAASSLLLRRHNLHLRRPPNSLHSITGKPASRRPRTFRNDCEDTDGSDEPTAYFHVSPSGDWWTGPSIFAAKHLQPDYVRSIPMPPGFDPELCFGDESEDEDDEETCDGDGGRGQRMPTLDDAKNTTMPHHKRNLQQSKLKLSWKEKQRLLHKIYDEGEIPLQLMSDCSLNNAKDGSDP